MKFVLMLMLIIGTAFLFTNAEEKSMPPADIAVILDSSRTIKKYRWHYLTGFFNDLVRRLNYGPQATRMAAIQFSTNAKEVISLGQYDTVDSVIQAMNKVPYKYGLGNSYKALNLLVDQTLSKENSRPGVQRVAVLVTDDKAKETALTEAAIKRVKDDGIKMVVVGIHHNKYFNYEELVKFADGDKSSVTVLKRLKGLSNTQKLDIIVPTILSAIQSEKQEEQACTDSDDWRAPNGWTGPDAAYYKSFENTNCMTLHNGAKLAAGKRGQAITTDNAQHQYIDLGVIVEQACIVTPSTCTRAGGTFSAWVKFIPSKTGKTFHKYIIDSADEPDFTYDVYTEGFHVKNSGGIDVTLASEELRDRHILKMNPTTDQWFHISVVFHGDTYKQDTYINGVIEYQNSKGYPDYYEMNMGNVIIGRAWAMYKFTDPVDDDFSSVAVDELLFFNRALTDKEVMHLYNSYS